MSRPEERKRAVELYPTTSTTNAEVVEHLGYPTRQCLERWLAKDLRHAGRRGAPIIPLETRQKAIEPVLGGMRQKQAARQLGVSVGAVAHWGKTYRGGGMAALPPRNRNTVQDGGAPRGRGVATPLAMTVTWRRCIARVGELELGNALVREVLALIDECIHWCNYDRIKQSLGWMSPVQYCLSHGLAA